ncbi:BrnT family toxin [methane-oxidizing endosymbiont of Gigantopelta aegis]|uniref:BrnT family toxin n=1 Tax=methane-oxidizing endosymbiont of Gigantopelta aegis TaxID=2794938 RepID=UPI0018DCEE88|nr:BrnT family toxin [methane-oxidizing endosymbiont of Gigantopelta aegis]
MYQFEFDEQKSKSNLEKHGIDFVTAQGLWNDSDLVRVKAKSSTELRYLVIARLAGKHWSAVITYRGQAIRIISVRRSRKSEVQIYES